MQDMLEVMRRRRSIRKFKPDKVSEAEIESLVNAGLLAPSAENVRPVELIVVRDKTTIERLAACRDNGGRALAGAPLAIVVLGRTSESSLWDADAAVAATYILLQAEQLGLGCCWVQMYKKFSANRRPADELSRGFLNPPPGLAVFCAMAIGHADEQKEPYSIEELDRSKVRSL